MFLCQKCHSRRISRGVVEKLSSKLPRRGCTVCQRDLICFDWVTPPKYQFRRKPGRPRKVCPAARADSSL